MGRNTTYEAIILNCFEHERQTKWNRISIGNLKPADDGSGYALDITNGLAISGRLIIQPVQPKREKPEAA